MTESIDGLLRDLDLETKVRMLAGQDMWSLPPEPAIGLGSVVMSDGPIGVRGVNWTESDPSIALPSPTALAASWDPELAYRAGQLLGQEAIRKGVNVLLAPTVNLHRTPFGGRHFEAYSEDPLLTGEIGSGYVSGVQSQGIGVTVKHFVGNDFETDRFSASAGIGDRALRELYMAPFEAIIAKAKPWGVMSAYNGVNGTTMSQHPLLLDVLKGEWGFDGAVVSDWLAAHDTEETGRGGLDLVMPNAGSPWGDALVKAVRSGAVSEASIDAKLRRLLLLAARLGKLDGYAPMVAPEDRPGPIDGEAVAREVASRSFVLAANPTGILPLQAGDLRKVALIGSNAKDARVLGGGSAMVFPSHVVSPLEGLRAALPDIEIAYAMGTNPREKYGPAKAPHWTGLTAVFRAHDGRELHRTSMPNGEGRFMELPEGVTRAELATVEMTGTLHADTTGTHQIAFRGIGEFTFTLGGEVVFDGGSYPDSGDLAVIFLAPPEHRFPTELTAGQEVSVSLMHRVALPEDFDVVTMTIAYREPELAPDDMIAEAVRIAAESDVAIVVVGTTEEVESEGFDRTTLALPGRQDELVRSVVAVNPRTIVVVNAGSPVELPWADDVAAVLLVWFPGQEAGHALADVLLGAVEPGGRLPTTWAVRTEDCPVLSTQPIDNLVPYDEGVFIGYRAWARNAVAPRYPFGHGQGYTTWAYERMDVSGSRVSVTVTNTGTRTGREVVQVYLAPVEPDADRPERWLAGFAGAVAAPGESVTVTVDLPRRAFEIWDDGWRTPSGAYAVEAAHSVADRRLSHVIEGAPDEFVAG
jgi:beta-glucosidase